MATPSRSRLTLNTVGRAEMATQAPEATEAALDVALEPEATVPEAEPPAEPEAEEDVSLESILEDLKRREGRSE